MTSEIKAYSTDPISKSIDRKVLGRVRENECACPDMEPKYPKNVPDKTN